MTKRLSPAFLLLAFLAFIAAGCGGVTQSSGVPAFKYTQGHAMLVTREGSTDVHLLATPVASLSHGQEWALAPAPDAGTAADWPRADMVSLPEGTQYLLDSLGNLTAMTPALDDTLLRIDFSVISHALLARSSNGDLMVLAPCRNPTDLLGELSQSKFLNSSICLVEEADGTRMVKAVRSDGGTLILEDNIHQPGRHLLRGGNLPKPRGEWFLRQQIRIKNLPQLADGLPKGVTVPPPPGNQPPPDSTEGLNMCRLALPGLHMVLCSGVVHYTYVGSDQVCSIPLQSCELQVEIGTEEVLLTSSRQGFQWPQGCCAQQ